MVDSAHGHPSKSSLAIPETVLPAPTLAMSEVDAKASMQWLADLAVREMPRKFDGDDGWGDVKRIWSGINLHREGLRIKTNRRYREVNHGRWIRYELSLPDSEDAVKIKLTNVTMIQDESGGAAVPSGWQIESTMMAPLAFSARIERWNLGTRWYSVSVTGNMRVRLDCTTTIQFLSDYSVIPPAMVIDPHVERASLALESFEVERISKLGGDVAEAWGEIVQEVIRHRIREKENASLVDRLNRSIGKRRDDLRWSLFDATTKWLGESSQKTE